MNCVWCRKKPAERWMFCQECDAELDETHKAFIYTTPEGKLWELGKAIEDFKVAVRASLPWWLRWLVR